MIKTMKNVKVRNLLLSFMVTVVLFLLYRMFTDFIYLTNDDMYLQAIVSGEISGKPDAHMIYSNYILGLFLSGLYRLSVQIPWYGMYLVGVCFLCFWTVLYRCMGSCRKISGYAAVIVIFSILSFCAFFRHVAMIQYTVVAALAGSTAVFLVLTMDMRQEKRGIIRDTAFVAALAGLSLLIREKVFFMLVPFAACGWLGKWMTEKEKTKEVNRRYVYFLVEILFLAAVLCGVDRLAYRMGSGGEQWREYREYNRAREQIYDYNGFPDYDANEEFYKELGISREAYAGASQYYLLLPQKAYHADTMKQIAALSGQQKKSREPFAERLARVAREFIRCNLIYSDRPMNLVVYGCWFVMLLFLILTKEKRLLVYLSLLFLARMGTWGLILYQGRYPDRITQSLYAVELLMLAAIFLNFTDIWRQWNQKRSFRTAVWAGVLLVCLPSLYVGVQKAKAVQGENAGKLYFGISYQQLKAYCAENPENLYLIDMNSASFFSCSVFKAAAGEQEVCRNLLPLGSWPVKSPLTSERLEGYQVSEGEKDFVNRDTVFFVFKDSSETPFAYLTDFYEAESTEDGETFILERVDTVNTDVDISYGIYQLKTVESYGSNYEKTMEPSKKLDIMDTRGACDNFISGSGSV